MGVFNLTVFKGYSLNDLSWPIQNLTPFGQKNMSQKRQKRKNLLQY